MNVLISACLLGLACRYDGQSKGYSAVEALLKEADIHLIPFCPEQGGGLATPRDPAERQGGAVRTKSGRDVTEQYRRGAAMALNLAKTFGCTVNLAKTFGCTVAVLKEKSPSCGSGRIYDGTFTRTLTAGDGVTAELLKKHGIIVIGESRISDYLQSRQIKTTLL